MERLTTAQAAARIGASRFAIHRAKEKGLLNPIRDNRGRYLFDTEEIDALAAQRAQPVAQSLRNDAPADPAPDAAQVEIAVLRDRLADAEKRATDAEKRAAVAAALALGKGRLNPAKNAPYSAILAYPHPRHQKSARPAVCRSGGSGGASVRRFSLSAGRVTLYIVTHIQGMRHQ
jgi:DNA-binding transcriptional MerR regulator